MVKNKYMYDKNTMLNVIKKLNYNQGLFLDKNIFTPEELTALYGVVRNWHIIQFGFDIDEPVSMSDILWRVKIKRALESGSSD